VKQQVQFLASDHVRGDIDAKEKEKKDHKENYKEKKKEIIS
jgi:hypothetical protein